MRCSHCQRPGLLRLHIVTEHQGKVLTDTLEGGTKVVTQTIKLRVPERLHLCAICHPDAPDPEPPKVWTEPPNTTYLGCGCKKSRYAEPESTYCTAHSTMLYRLPARRRPIKRHTALWDLIMAMKAEHVALWNFGDRLMEIRARVVEESKLPAPGTVPLMPSRLIEGLPLVEVVYAGCGCTKLTQRKPRAAYCARHGGLLRNLARGTTPRRGSDTYNLLMALDPEHVKGWRHGARIIRLQARIKEARR